jgi:chemotaxis protein MotA
MLKDKGYLFSLVFVVLLILLTFTDPYKSFLGFLDPAGIFIVEFFDPLSLIIVVGGCFAATVMHFSASKVKLAFQQVTKLMQYVNMDLRTELEMLTLFARRVRSNGILSMDEDVDHMYSEYMQTGMRMAVDGYDPVVLEKILEDEITNLNYKYDLCVDVLNGIKDYAPGFGMIGTVVGMVLCLANAMTGDVPLIIAGVKIALLTTLWGSIIANVIASPLAGKCEFLAALVERRNKMYKDAILAMVQKINPRELEERLLTYIDAGDRVEYLKHHQELKGLKERDAKLYSIWKETTGLEITEWENLKKKVQVG